MVSLLAQTALQALATLSCRVVSSSELVLNTRPNILMLGTNGTSWPPVSMTTPPVRMPDQEHVPGSHDMGTRLMPTERLHFLLRIARNPFPL